MREHGFTREDATVLSYGTFGLNQTHLGVTMVVTFDRPFINNFANHRQTLTRRLKAMTRQLREPYHLARLPEMGTPEQVLQVPDA
ncbi:hypothetical protein HYR99_22585 [Candidatus Poribacteria bacterium]|nr:hypothetical protein [Candidatus Poribacteria bacterium]